jgi:hypothetical protein
VVNNVTNEVIFGVALVLLNPYPSAGLAFEHVAFFHLGDENLKFVLTSCCLGQLAKIAIALSDLFDQFSMSAKTY